MTGDKIVRLRAKVRRDDKGKMLEETKWNRACKHRLFKFDLALNEVECRDCHEKLSPMWVLSELAKQESIWMSSKQSYQDEMKRLSDRSRTRCDHCGKMTQISRGRRR